MRHDAFTSLSHLGHGVLRVEDTDFHFFRLFAYDDFHMNLIYRFLFVELRSCFVCEIFVSSEIRLMGRIIVIATNIHETLGIIENVWISMRASVRHYEWSEISTRYRLLNCQVCLIKNLILLSSLCYWCVIRFLLSPVGSAFNHAFLSCKYDSYRCSVPPLTICMWSFEAYFVILISRNFWNFELEI